MTTEAKKFGPSNFSKFNAASIALSICLSTLAIPVHAETAAKTKIAVFDFELNDESAGGGIIAQDEIDSKNLKLAAEEAKRLLIASGRYEAVDTSGVSADMAAAKGVINCKSCEVPLAKKVGADQALIGVISRVNRTEFTLFMRVSDAQTGDVVATGFTGLRMGANYAWPRGVKWLLDNKLLAEMMKK